MKKLLLALLTVGAVFTHTAHGDKADFEKKDKWEYGIYTDTFENKEYYVIQQRFEYEDTVWGREGKYFEDTWGSRFALYPMREDKELRLLYIDFLFVYTLDKKNPEQGLYIRSFGIPLAKSLRVDIRIDDSPIFNTSLVPEKYKTFADYSVSISLEKRDVKNFILKLTQNEKMYVRFWCVRGAIDICVPIKGLKEILEKKP